MTGGHDHCCRLEAVAGHAGPVVLGGGLVVDPQGEPGLGQSDGGIVPLVIAVHRGRNSAPISGFDLSHDIIFIIGNDYRRRYDAGLPGGCDTKRRRRRDVDHLIERQHAVSVHVDLKPAGSVNGHAPYVTVLSHIEDGSVRSRDAFVDLAGEAQPGGSASVGDLDCQPSGPTVRLPSFPRIAIGSCLLYTSPSPRD